MLARLHKDKVNYLKTVMDLQQQLQDTRHLGGRWLAWFDAERMTIFLFLLHFMATMVTWQHFFVIKFKAQEAKVPDGANLYWWKRLVPPIEFGAMHTMLLQMALLPLTMARHSISLLSQTMVAKFVPFHRMIAMHIHLGYTLVSITFGSTLLFFVFFGQGCAQQHSGQEPMPEGKKTFCDKMTSEIMLTGCGIPPCSLLLNAFECS